MNVRQRIHSDHAKQRDTAGLRREFLIEKIFEANQYTMTYSHIERISIGGVHPIDHSVSMGDEVGKQLGVSHFLARRKRLVRRDIINLKGVE